MQITIRKILLLAILFSSISGQSFPLVHSVDSPQTLAVKSKIFSLLATTMSFSVIAMALNSVQVWSLVDIRSDIGIDIKNREKNLDNNQVTVLKKYKQDFNDKELLFWLTGFTHLAIVALPFYGWRDKSQHALPGSMVGVCFFSLLANGFSWPANSFLWNNRNLASDHDLDKPNLKLPTYLGIPTVVFSVWALGASIGMLYIILQDDNQISPLPQAEV